MPSTKNLVTLSKGILGFKEDGRTDFEDFLEVEDFKFNTAVEKVDTFSSRSAEVVKISSIVKSVTVSGSFVCKIAKAEIMRFFGMAKEVKETTQTSGTWTNQSFTVYKNKWKDLGKLNLSSIVVKKTTTGTTFTADADTDTFTANAHGLVNGNAVQVSNTGGALPGGLMAGTTYYVIAAATNTFQLAATLGGTYIDISSAGTGTHSFIRVYIEGTDYEMIKEAGMFFTLQDGDITDASTIYISASYSEQKYHEIEIATKTDIKGYLKFIGRPVAGLPEDFNAYVQINPEGDFQMIGDDIQKYTIKFECMKVSDTTPLATWRDRSGKSYSVAAVA